MAGFVMGNHSYCARSAYYTAEIERLDKLSRERVLTEAESILLERHLSRVHRKSGRAPLGSTRELAMHGIKRGVAK
jgi:biotin synthase-like enzyme